MMTPYAALTRLMQDLVTASTAEEVELVKQKLALAKQYQS